MDNPETLAKLELGTYCWIIRDYHTDITIFFLFLPHTLLCHVFICNFISCWINESEYFFPYVYFPFFLFKLAASKALGVPLTIYCQSNIDPGKKEFLLHEGANLVLHGNDCMEAELKARSDAQVYN